jgi:DNA-binding MarR family transcriptional regulator
MVKSKTIIKLTMTKQATETASHSATKAAAQEAFMPLMRELARTYQAFTNYSDAHVRTLGLTPPQFDVISTLGNTSGMSMNKLAEKTLVTKGALTGIVDRLEKKGLVRREVPSDNRRSFTIVLTPAGEWVFEQFFPAHIAHLKQRFERLNPQELEQIHLALKKLREIF